MKVLLRADGGARGNPGPAAIGVVLEFPGSDRPPREHAAVIGETTNNVAEYEALLWGLREAIRLGATEVECLLDSELVVRQLAGAYRVRNMRLRGLHDAVQELRASFAHVEFRAVPRRENARADRLLNDALDRRKNPLVPRAPTV